MKTANSKRLKQSFTVLAVFAMAMISVSALSGCVKVVKIGDEGKITGEKSFDPTSTVDEFWDSKLMPELKSEAVDLGTLLTESDNKPTSLSDKYGKGSKKNVFVVSGTGTVASPGGQSGVLAIRLDGYTGNQEIRIQIGPIYEGTSIRDSLSFLSVEDVANQVEWANLSKSINQKVASDVVSKIDLGNAEGKVIKFIGCFAGDNVLITPVELEIT